MTKSSVNTGNLLTWLDSLHDGAKVSARQHQVLAILRSQPRLASYGSVGDIARASASNPSTVTRTAQTLGFSGWTDFQYELRSRYLASLSAVEVAAEHASKPHSPGLAAITTDRENLAHLARNVDADAIIAAAAAIAAARRTYIIAAGSYAIPGRALEHNGLIAGYDVRLLDGDVAALSNSLASVGPEDLLIVISLWRVYDSTVRATELAHEAGARVVSITDTEGSRAARRGEPRIVVPSEGAGFFPSLIPALAVAQAIAVELASIDRVRSNASIAASERSWDAMRIMRRRHSG